MEECKNENKHVLGEGFIGEGGGLLVDPGWLPEATDHPKCNVSPPKVMLYRKRDQQLKENQEKEKVKETCQKRRQQARQLGKPFF